MARVYLHLRDGTDTMLDEEGQEFPDMEAIRKAVLDGARDVLANEIKSAGVIGLHYRIDAEDAAGKVVYSLPFAEAVTIQH